MGLRLRVAYRSKFFAKMWHKAEWMGFPLWLELTRIGCSYNLLIIIPPRRLYSICCCLVVTHLSMEEVHDCLTLVIEWEAVFSAWLESFITQKLKKVRFYNFWVGTRPKSVSCLISSMFYIETKFYIDYSVSNLHSGLNEIAFNK